MSKLNSLARITGLTIAFTLAGFLKFEASLAEAGPLPEPPHIAERPPIRTPVLPHGYTIAFMNGSDTFAYIDGQLVTVRSPTNPDGTTASRSAGVSRANKIDAADLALNKKVSEVGH